MHQEQRVHIKKSVVPKTQRQRNRVLQEFNKNDGRLQIVENLFLEMLFDDEFEKSDLSYNHLYEAFLERWHETIHFMTSVKSFKNTYPNKYYFRDMYMPTIHERTNNIQQPEQAAT